MRKKKVKAKLQSVELKQKSVLVMHFQSPEMPDIDFVGWVNVNNRPYPSKGLRVAVKALNHGEMGFYGGATVWKGTAEEIKEFFEKKIGCECMISAEPFVEEIYKITLMEVCK